MDRNAAPHMRSAALHIFVSVKPMSVFFSNKNLNLVYLNMHHRSFFGTVKTVLEAPPCCKKILVNLLYIF